ncbi:MAG: hypothetical protein ACOYUZ_02115 [Patescibacteria group bacterium]
MQAKIYCLMTGGLYLTEEICDILMYTAMYMIRDKSDKRNFKIQTAEGRVTTQFEPASLGGIGGYLFEAEIEVSVGKRNISFIVRSGDYEGLDKAVWQMIDLVREQQAEHQLN